VARQARGATTLALAILALIGAMPRSAAAQSNIDPDATGRRHAWSENGGWANLRPHDTHGVRVTSAGYLSGSAWMENLGWVSFGEGTPANGTSWTNTSAGDHGVNLGPGGVLSGYAWGENIGWIAVDPSGTSGVAIDGVSGRFVGYAWAENLGWVSFEDVPSLWVATVDPELVPLEISGIMIR
jgi:hypothetical protein